MTNPTPERLSALMQRAQSRWQQPERRLVNCEAALARRFLLGSQEQVRDLQSHFADARRATAAVEEQLPVVRDILLWTRNPAARLPFALFSDFLGVTSEEMAGQLLGEMDRDLLAILENKQPLTCPLCDRKR